MIIELMARRKGDLGTDLKGSSPNARMGVVEGVEPVEWLGHTGIRAQ